MSIYEVMAAAAEYREASAFNGECVAKINLLRAAIVLHVAEAVAREREGCAKACEDVATTQWDEYAASYNSAVFDCAAAIRTRAEKETK